MDAQLIKTSPQPETEPVARVWDLTKVYRTGFWFDRKIASLQGVNLSVNVGETFGMLGANGAGKTTLLKILLGIARPTSGRAMLLGRPAGDRAAREKVGYLPENPYFYMYLTGWETLQFAAGLFRLPTATVRQRILELLDLVGIARVTAKKKPLRQYSKGMLQRIGMAQALIADPEVVFLDEPMSGLDPLGRYQMREIILSLKARGRTVFFNSHVLADVEQICDRIAILARGEVLCVGALEELLGTDETCIARGKGGNPHLLRKWMPDLTFEARGWQGQLQGNTQDFLSSLKLMDAELLEMYRSRPTLESFFVRQLRERDLDAPQ